MRRALRRRPLWNPAGHYRWIDHASGGTRDRAPASARLKATPRCQDPTLVLVGANGEVVRANDNWKGIQRAEIEAIGLQPSDDRESTLIATLTAGNYTAVVRGKDNTTGVAVVEVYNLQ